MLEICFSKSAAAILREAKENGSKLGDILCFDLQMNLGEIRDYGDIEKRAWVYKEYYDNGYFLVNARQCMDELTEKTGERANIRFWYSYCPGEYCGMMFIIWKLKCRLMHYRGIQCQRSAAIPGSGVERRQYQNLSHYDAHHVNYLLSFENEIRVSECNYYELKWQKLIQENAPLRVVEKGIVYSKNIDYYDGLILAYIPEAPMTVGSAVGNFILTEDVYVPYYFIRYRIRELVDAGKIRLVQKKEPFIKSIIQKGI